MTFVAIANNIELPEDININNIISNLKDYYTE